MSIKQKTGALFPKPATVVNSDGSILSGLSHIANERAGWILAGGQSRRMGSDKALIEIDGELLLARTANILLATCGSVAVIGDPARYGAFGLPVIADRFPGLGPLAGIEAALGATHVDWNLIVACDMPALDRETIETLFEAVDGDCALPAYPDGKVEPLCAVYHRRAHSAILAALESGARRITEALERVAVRYVRIHRPEPFANLNTPQDLANFLSARAFSPHPNG